VTGFDRRYPVKNPFPAHLPRERVVIEAPFACSCCGLAKIVKMGEDITETLEVVPRQWKLIQTVWEKLTCRDCETISQPTAPFHPVSRGWAGPKLLAMCVFRESWAPISRDLGQPFRGCGQTGRRLHGVRLDRFGQAVL
jgi:transposase